VVEGVYNTKNTKTPINIERFYHMKRKVKTALVVEGGGMRGVFAAGVLDYFLEKKFDPFDLYLGVSAGACNLASHLGKQHGRNYRCYTDYMLRPDFFSMKKYVRGGHYMDLDWFWDYCAKVEPLNVNDVLKKIFYVIVTNVHTGSAEYLRTNERTIFDALKGSSALPLLYRKRIKLNNSEYIDGGVTDPIPIMEAYRQGARRIMVIRSQLAGYSKNSFFESKFIPLLFWRYPSLRKALGEREARYNELLDFIKNPPADADVIELCPSILYSGRTTRDRELLDRDYAEGKRMGFSAIQKWKGK
jgi:predicted patatin/cPLA2 family phospholipase